MRIRPLDIGVESIDELHRADDVHLPKEGVLNQPFLPRSWALDDILRRPSLEERLPAMLKPTSLDPELLQPSILAAVRLDSRALFARQALGATGRRRALLEQAVSILDDAAELDGEVQAKLAELLRG